MLNHIFDLAALGYVVTDAYADGIVRMAKTRVGTRFTEEHYVFLWANGRGRNDVSFHTLPLPEMTEGEMDDIDHWEMMGRI